MSVSKKNKVLFITGELIAGDLAYQLKKEGHDVKLYIEAESDRGCFDGMVDKTDDWEKELEWVGKDGLIVFDDVGYGEAQDKMRQEGYLVVGGSGDGDRLELDRKYGQSVLKLCGVQFNSDFDTRPFTVDSAIEFVKKQKGEWVIKQDDHNTALNYVGTVEDGSDVVSMLESYRVSFGGLQRISLQKRVRGVEIAVGRFFNGKDWVGPSILNIEHKHLCNDDIGPLGGETGTLMWYEKDENNKLFRETLAKLKPQLQKSNYKGYIDINCIVSDSDTVYPLEVTSRFGSSTNQMQSEIQISAWGEFLTAIARGEDYPLRYKDGYGIATALTVSPFPYKTSDKSLSQRGVNIFFKEGLSEEEFSHIHFEEVSIKRENEKDIYYIGGNSGYVLYVTGFGETVEEARKRVYSIIDKIIIPKAFYRTDIGLRFIRNDKRLLMEWGWIR